MIAQAAAPLLNICHDVSLHSQYSKSGYWGRKRTGFFTFLPPGTALKSNSMTKQRNLRVWEISVCAWPTWPPAWGCMLSPHSRSIKLTTNMISSIVSRRTARTFRHYFHPLPALSCQTHHLINKETLLR